MNIKSYALSVSLAAVVGLLLAVVPLVRGTLDYRSPSVEITEPKELSSVEMLIATRASKDEAYAAIHLRRGLDRWQEIYDAAKAQHADAARQQVELARNNAKRNLIAYGSLFSLCLVLLITHLLWSRTVT